MRLWQNEETCILNVKWWKCPKERSDQLCQILLIDQIRWRGRKAEHWIWQVGGHRCFWMFYGSSCYCQYVFSFMTFFFFFGRHMSFRTLVPPPGIEQVPPTVEAQSPNHWTAREFPMTFSNPLLMEYRKLLIFVSWFFIGPPYWILLLFLIIYQLIYLYILGRKSYLWKYQQICLTFQHLYFIWH